MLNVPLVKTKRNAWQIYHLSLHILPKQVETSFHTSDKSLFLNDV